MLASPCCLPLHFPFSVTNSFKQVCSFIIHYQWLISFWSFKIILTSFIIILFFIAVGSGSISTVIPPTDYYNSASSYPQYSSPYGGYSYGTSGSLLTKWGTYQILFIIVRNLDFKKSNLAQSGPIWTNLDHSGPFWTILDHLGSF